MVRAIDAGSVAIFATATVPEFAESLSSCEAAQTADGASVAVAGRAEFSQLGFLRDDTCFRAFEENVYDRLGVLRDPRLESCMS